EARKLQGEAEAVALRVQGNAEAEVIKAKGEAEASALQVKAGAYQEFNQAAVLDRLLGEMPEVVRALAEPLSRVDKITVISTGADGTGQGTGVNRVATDVTSMIAQFPAMLESLTGVRLEDLMKSVHESTNGFRVHRPSNGSDGARREEPVPARKPQQTEPPTPRVDAEPVVPANPAESVTPPNSAEPVATPGEDKS
ncbi:MAG TPA: flotillin domain-containing protein, partial [Thermomicrobiales bacterium]|nr:flotillin domain-containing protein [Thermomicrobiales bacterium]